MLPSLVAPVRILFLVAALALAASAVDARSSAPDQPQSTARTLSQSKGEPQAPAPDGVSVEGVLIILGIVGVVIVLAWVASRVGDSR
jgi:hypothetical protein